MTFITPPGLYCYKVMFFGLKNAITTLIGQTVEVYINNIIVKSKTHVEHIQHLEEEFNLMHKYNIKLNPFKCAFEVSTGKFFGFMVTQSGIEVNPAQVKVVLETPVPTSRKKKQRLTSRLAALSQFIAYFTDKLCHFFITLRGANIFGWTDECKHTFEAIKRYLVELPILSSPKANEELYMYLAVSNCAISVMLFWNIQSGEQRLIYYLSKAMLDVETCYSQVEQTT